MIVLAELTRLGARNLARNRRRALLSGATVAIGVAAIVFCKSYIDGLERLILEFVIEAREGALQVRPREEPASLADPTLAGELPETGALADRIAASRAIAAVAPRLILAGTISNGEATAAMMAIGVDPAAEQEVCPRGPGAHPAGALRGPGLSSRDADEVVLGDGLARALALAEGDLVTLLVQTRGGSFDSADLVVRGTYRFPDPFEDKHLAVIPLSVAQRLAHAEGRVSLFALATASKGTAAIDRAAAALGRSLAALDLPAEVHAWHEVSPYFRDVITMQGQLMVVVVVVVFVLVVTGIAATMLMSVMERTRELGTLMAIGFRRRRILTLVLIEASLLTAASSAVGLAVGASLVVVTGRDGITFELPGAGFVQVHPTLDASYLLWAVLAAAVGGLIGGLVPARRAARMRPIDAIRS